MSGAISTYPVYLMTGEYENNSIIYHPLVEIKDFNDINGNVETLDKTTTSNAETSQIEGIKTNEVKRFTCNFNITDFDKIQSLQNQQQYVAILFGHEGEYGKFVGEGFVSAHINGSSANEVVNMTVSLNVTNGLYETFDPVLVDWTTNFGANVQTQDNENMQLNIAPYKNIRKLFRNGVLSQRFDFL